jgi:serine protease Do
MTICSACKVPLLLPGAKPFASFMLAALLLLADPFQTELPGREAQAATPPAAVPSLPGREVSLPDFSALVEQQGQAVVNVVTFRSASNGPGDILGGEDEALSEFLRRFFPDGLPGQGPRQPVRGLGSGFVISPDGLILTNAHVVAEAEEVTIRMADGKREFKGKVVGADSRSDIALVKVEASGLPTLKLGSTTPVRPGQWVAAIGSPFGFSNTITAGIVSATGRNLPNDAFVSFIQTDVAVNPGNSGGPLLNLRGEVIGVNSIIYSRTGGYMGVSFAIPIEVALDVVKQLQTQGKVTRGQLGVSIQPVTREMAQAFKLDNPVGALVSHVQPGSPADKAQLRSGDIILSYNGRTIQEVNDLPRLVASSRPGSQAKLVIWRNGNKRNIDVTVGELPTEKAEESAPVPSGQTPNRLGLVLRDIPPEQRRQLGIEHGLVVEAVRDAAARTPIRPGDIIRRYNQTEVTDLAQFNSLLAKEKPGASVALLVQRGQGTTYVTLKVADDRKQ